MTIHFQANSILASDRTTSKKKSKKDDFLEEENILKQALTANPCNGSTASGEPELLLCNLSDFVSLRFAWDFDQLSSKHWGLRHPFDWRFFNSGRGERMQDCGGKPHCRSDLSNLKLSSLDQISSYQKSNCRIETLLEEDSRIWALWVSAKYGWIQCR